MAVMIECPMVDIDVMQRNLIQEMVVPAFWAIRYI